MAGFPDRLSAADAAFIVARRVGVAAQKPEGFSRLSREPLVTPTFHTLPSARDAQPRQQLPSQGAPVPLGEPISPAQADVLPGLVTHNVTPLFVHAASGTEGTDAQVPTEGGQIHHGVPGESTTAAVPPVERQRTARTQAWRSHRGEATADSSPDAPKLVYPDLDKSGSNHSLKEQITRWYASGITSGALVPGDPLPSPAQIQAHCDISAHTGRSAYLVLASMGLIDTFPGTGSVVRHQGERTSTNLADPLGLEVPEVREALGITQNVHNGAGVEITTDSDRELFGVSSSDAIITQKSSDHRGPHLLSETTIRTPMVQDGAMRISESLPTPSDPGQAVSVLRARMPTVSEASTFTLSGGVPVMEIMTFYSNSAGVEMVTTKILPADRNSLTNPEASDSSGVSRQVTVGAKTFDLAEFVFAKPALSQADTKHLPYPPIGSRGGMQSQLINAYAEAIEKGALTKGAPFPPLRQISEHYSVSRNTAIALVSNLEQMGLVESQQGTTAYVRRETPQITTAIAHPSRRESDEIRRVEGNGFKVENVTEKDMRLFGVDDESHVLIVGTVEEHHGDKLLAITTSSKPIALSNMSKPEITFVPSNPDRNRSAITVRMPNQDELTTFKLLPGVPVIEVETYYLDTTGNVELATTTILPADRNKLVK